MKLFADCKECNESFHKDRKDRVFCSAKCRKKYNNRGYGRTRNPIVKQCKSKPKTDEERTWDIKKNMDFLCVNILGGFMGFKLFQNG